MFRLVTLKQILYFFYLWTAPLKLQVNFFSIYVFEIFFFIIGALIGEALNLQIIFFSHLNFSILFHDLKFTWKIIFLSSREFWRRLHCGSSLWTPSACSKILPSQHPSADAFSSCDWSTGCVWRTKKCIRGCDTCTWCPDGCECVAEAREVWNMLCCTRRTCDSWFLDGC